MAHEVVALSDALETAEEAICNFAEQRNEAMREVDRLLSENARLNDRLTICMADIERAADRASVFEARLHGITRDFSMIRASRDEACGLLREARRGLVEQDKTIEFLHNDRMAIVAERNDAQARTYTDEQRDAASKRLRHMFVYNGQEAEADRAAGVLVDTIAQALGMRRAGQ